MIGYCGFNEKYFNNQVFVSVTAIHILEYIR